jgi:hypothetical protein
MPLRKTALGSEGNTPKVFFARSGPVSLHFAEIKKYERTYFRISQQIVNSYNDLTMNNHRNDIMAKAKKILIFILLLFTFWSVIAKYRKLTTPRYYTETDSLGMMLQSIKETLPLSSKIGFNTNTSPDRKLLLYFKTALFFAPIVLELGDNDTVLFLEDSKSPSQPKDKYESIIEGKNKDYNYMLVRKRDSL